MQWGHFLMSFQRCTLLLTLTSSSLFPPKAPTRPHWVAEGTPLLCLGVVAVPGDWISHPRVGGLHHSLFSREHQGITVVRIRAWIYLLQPGCVFCKRLKAVRPCPKSLFYFFLAFPHAVHAAAVTHGPGVLQPVAAPAPASPLPTAFLGV